MYAKNGVSRGDKGDSPPRGISLLRPMKPILVLDNYDSFTYNLVHLLTSVSDQPVHVKRNDEIDPEALTEFDMLLVSPGPGLPPESGRLMEILTQLPPKMPVLGVCLGMQALALQSGGSLFQLPDVQHGIETSILTDPEADRLGLYHGLPNRLTVGRYHSWMVQEANLPPEWNITARDELGRIMSMTHRHHLWQGVQFHPESVMTPEGKSIIQNWLRAGTPTGDN